MGQHIRLDVSLKDTALAIRQDGKRIWRGKCPSAPRTLARTIHKLAPKPQRVEFETGPLDTWFSMLLRQMAYPQSASKRHAQKILSETLNKTDANDADGLAPLDVWHEVRERVAALT